MIYRRAIIGLLGLATLCYAAFVLFAMGDATSFFANVCLRLGIVFGALFLAWPTMERLATRLPVIVNGAILLFVAGLIIRPNLARILTILVVITLAVHFGMRFWAQQSKRES